MRNLLFVVIALSVILSYQNCGKPQSGSSDSSDTDINTTQNLLAAESQSLSAGEAQSLSAGNGICSGTVERSQFRLEPVPSLISNVRYVLRGTRINGFVGAPPERALTVDRFQVAYGGGYQFVSSASIPNSQISRGTRYSNCRFLPTNFNYTFSEVGYFRFRAGGTPQMPSDLDDGQGASSFIFAVVNQLPATSVDTLNVSVVDAQAPTQNSEIFRLVGTMRITASASQRLAACATYQSGDGCNRFPENYIFIDPPGSNGFNCSQSSAGVSCSRTQAVRLGFGTTGDFKLIFVNVGGYNRVLQRVEKFVRIIN